MFHDCSELEYVQFKFNEKHFITKDFSYILKEVNDSGKCLLKLSVVPLCISEWELIYQLRVKTGLSSSSLQIVDKTIVQFSPSSNEISFELLDDIKFVDFELRTINEFNLICPTFAQGDVILRLKDGSYVKTYKSLLSLSSEALCAAVSSYPAMNCLDLSNLSRNAVLQYLYRLYPNRRMMNQNFDDFAKASVALCSRSFIHKISEYVCSSSFKPTPLVERLKIALKLRLTPAIRKIMMKLVQSGEWDVILEQDPNFLETVPLDVYNTLLQPIIAQKRFNEAKVEEEIDFFSETAATNPHNMKVILLDTAFYVNTGILSVNGTKGFEKLPDGSLVARFSKRLQRECALVQCTPGEVLRLLLTQMYPGGSSIPLKLERAALVFCSDHKWTKMIQILEQAYMRNPCTSEAEFYLYLTFADELNLQNLKRRCLLYAEGSCKQYAHQLIHSPDFNKFTEKTRRLLVDHVFCGWSVNCPSNEALSNRLALRVPNIENKREIGHRRGGPKGYEDDQQTDHSFDN
ncbi:unnamed protein product [Auanema sp. JU1783]|nr:unnamed protein product [Auanema sp. JU1783]